MAFPDVLTPRDDFNRPNGMADGWGALNCSFSNPQLWAYIQSHRLWCIGGSWECHTYWYAKRFGVSQYAFAKIYPMSFGWQTGLLLRVVPMSDSPGHSYEVSIAPNGTSIRICRVTYWTNRNTTPLSTASIALSAGDEICGVAIGATVSAYHRPYGGVWSLALSYIDPSPYLDVGYIGAVTSRADWVPAEGQIDDFGGGNQENIVDFTPNPVTMGLRSVDPVVLKSWFPFVMLSVHSQSDGSAPTQVINLTQNDMLPRFKFHWLDADGDAYDLSSATVRFRMRARDAEQGVYTVNVACTHEMDAVTCLLDDADTDTPGEFYADLLMDLDGLLLTSETFLVRIREAL